MWEEIPLSTSEKNEDNIFNYNMTSYYPIRKMETSR
jgi:hypothetical protein